MMVPAAVCTGIAARWCPIHGDGRPCRECAREACRLYGKRLRHRRARVRAAVLADAQRRDDRRLRHDRMWASLAALFEEETRRVARPTIAYRYDD